MNSMQRPGQAGECAWKLHERRLDTFTLTAAVGLVPVPGPRKSPSSAAGGRDGWVPACLPACLAVLRGGGEISALELAS